jgi:excisionase family DNA binding protein
MLTFPRAIVALLIAAVVTMDVCAASAATRHASGHGLLLYVSLGAGIAVFGAAFSTENSTIFSPLLTPDEAAALLRSNPRTLERWRTAGGGPAFCKVGRRVCYRREDLDAWLSRQRRENTLATAPPAA